MDSRERLRATFAEDAELYDRVRPGYPAACFDDLIALAGLPPRARTLGIGPGTGQATPPLAERGYRVTAVELGEALAAVACRNLARFPDVTAQTAAFEDWPVPPQPFDLVLAATAFHWLDPAVRWRKAAAALRPVGSLALIETIHVAAGDVDFFEASQRCYEWWDPDTPPGGIRLPAPGAVSDAAAVEEVVASGFFGPPQVRRYLREISYSTAAYLDVLNTYSGHRALPSPAREGLLRCIAELIDTASAAASARATSPGWWSRGGSEAVLRLCAWCSHLASAISCHDIPLPDHAPLVGRPAERAPTRFQSRRDCGRKDLPKRLRRLSWLG